ncbi:glycoside hydrolase family 10 protein [Poriferisphaera sp. WC338]|uniref:glycoside hydrolase family 10 protein n=1 Tax=Poriferisphaera sp. WC338 TaxID=3425129 RepID=UPI003D81C027
MRQTRWTGLFLSLTLSLLVACSATGKPATKEQLKTIPDVPTEFRAAWVATVSNIDWPSKPGLSTKQQQKELIDILDRCAEMNLNAVIFQVRTTADAFYQSDLEPWSYYLTGKQGQAPKPFYDPLKFAVEEAHKRGIELHAWFNPYRASQEHGKYEYDPSHIYKTNPDLVKTYGKKLWMDPGEPEVMKRSMDVFLDVAKRYDVDGIHIDDYFYPYRVANTEFPDKASYAKYQKAGGKLGVNDWRRHNVDTFIETFYKKLKKTRNDVKFGISPFGIWKPGYPSNIQGMNQFEMIYADAKLWWNKGWLDYFTPQLYWEIRKPAQSFPSLLGWWESENTKGRYLWPGMACYRVKDGTKRELDEKEIPFQIDWTRSLTKNGPGAVFFSMKQLMTNRGGLTKSISAKYSKRALVPSCDWLKAKAPKLPNAKVAMTSDEGVTVKLDKQSAADAINWIVQVKRGGKWYYEIEPVAKRTMKVDTKGGKVEMVVVTTVGRNSVMSPKSVISGK